MNTNSIKKKLRSNRGASLSVALLLFLACAVLGSIVLKTATAASGRLAGVEEADQRYYSVNSAADLLAEELDGQTVHINRAQVTTTSYTHTYVTDQYNNTTLKETKKKTPSVQGPAYYAIQDADSSNSINKDEDYKKFFDNSERVSSNDTLLIKAAYRFLFDFSEAESTGSPANMGTIWKTMTPKGDQNKILEERLYRLEHDTYDFLDVQVVEQIRGDGTIIFVVSNDPVSGDDVYQVRLTFTPTIQSKTARKTENETEDIEFTPVVGGESTLTETDTLYEYRYTAITWTLTEVKKAGFE